VSCDISGSFEFMGKASTIDKPFYMWDPITKTMHDDIEKPGIQIISIDNLPTEMPLEASEYFSDALFPIISEMARGNLNHPIIERATIAKDGKLAAKFQKLEPIVAKYGATNVQTKSQKNVLLLGSGFVSKPLVDYLLRDPHTMVTIASNEQAEALALSEGRKNAPIVPLNVSDTQSLGKLVKAHDIVVSFVPATLHPIVAEQCLTYKKNLVTASYISPAMKAYDARYFHLTQCQGGKTHLFERNWA
jgi:alpha-aminoadipic semialdehyde synthase